MVNRNYNGILNLPSNVEALNILTGFDTNDQKYATGISIDLSELNPEIHLEANQNKVLTQETEQFEIYDYEKDDDLDIKEKPTNTPLNTKSTRLITLKNGTRDIIEDDPTYRNIGSFSVTAPLLSSASVSKDQLQFNISDYNQNNNTNYLGVKSIVLTAPEYTACDLLIPTQSTNENMDQNNHLITSQWDIYTQNGTSTLWKLFDPTNTDGVTSCWYDNQYLNLHFTGTGTPLVPNKLIYKYLGINDSRYQHYHIVLTASDDNVNWTTLFDLNFADIGDREYFNENSNQIEIPLQNYHAYYYYQFKEMDGYGYEGRNQFNYWNLLNCHSEQETPTTINNYNGYTVSSPFQINSTGTGTISIPNGYTGLGNVNYNVNVPQFTIQNLNITSQGIYEAPEGIAYRRINAIIPGSYNSNKTNIYKIKLIKTGTNEILSSNYINELSYKKTNYENISVGAFSFFVMIEKLSDSKYRVTTLYNDKSTSTTVACNYNSRYMYFYDENVNNYGNVEVYFENENGNNVFQKMVFLYQREKKIYDLIDLFNFPTFTPDTN